MIKSYNELTIEKYRKILEIEKPEDEMEYGIEILSILSGLEVDDLLELPLDKFTSLMKATSFLYEPAEKNDYKDLGKTITINDNEYTLIKSAKELTAGQYIDYKSYTQKDNFFEMLPWILTVFLVPKGHKYCQGYDVAELAMELDKSLDIITALSISDFFFFQSIHSIKASLICLKWKTKRMAKKEKNMEIKMKLMELTEQMESLQNSISLLVGSIQR